MHMCQNGRHVLLTSYLLSSMLQQESQHQRMLCSLSLRNNRKSSCEMFVALSQGKGGGEYKHLQLVEMHSLEILFVLGTDTKHQCK